MDDSARDDPAFSVPSLSCLLEFSGPELERKYVQRRLAQLARGDWVRAVARLAMFTAASFAEPSPMRRSLDCARKTLLIMAVLMAETAVAVLVPPRQRAAVRPYFMPACKLFMHVTTLWGLACAIQPVEELQSVWEVFR